MTFFSPSRLNKRLSRLFVLITLDHYRLYRYTQTNVTLTESWDATFFFHFFSLQLLNGTILTQSQIVTGGSGDKDGDNKIIELASDIAKNVPELFDVLAATEKYPTRYEQSMNTVIRQVSYLLGLSTRAFYYTCLHLVKLQQTNNDVHQLILNPFFSGRPKHHVCLWTFF